MDDVIKQLEDNNIPYKIERRLATVYIFNDDDETVEEKEQMCDVITVEGTGHIPIKY